MSMDSLLILMGVIGIYLLNGLFRKGSLKRTHAHYSETFFSGVPAYKTFKAIMTFASENGYQIDNVDEQHFAVILNERMTWKSYGFLYPIYVREQAGGTIVEVGVTSKLGKFILINPFNKKVMTVRCERMLNAVKGAVAAFERSDK
jgi:hypothetical protein